MDGKCPRTMETDGAFPLETDAGFCLRLSLSLIQSDGLRPSIINRITTAPLTLPLITSLGPEVELYTGYAKRQITRRPRQSACAPLGLAVEDSSKAAMRSLFVFLFNSCISGRTDCRRPPT